MEDVTAGVAGWGLEAALAVLAYAAVVLTGIWRAINRMDHRLYSLERHIYGAAFEPAPPDPPPRVPAGFLGLAAPSPDPATAEESR